MTATAMPADNFWHIIERAAQSHDPPYPHVEALRVALRELSLEDIYRSRWCFAVISTKRTRTRGRKVRRRQARSGVVRTKFRAALSAFAERTADRSHRPVGTGVDHPHPRPVGVVDQGM